MTPEDVETFLLQCLKNWAVLDVAGAGALLLSKGWLPRGGVKCVTYIEPSRRAARKALDPLLEKGLITLKEKDSDGSRARSYFLVRETEKPNPFTLLRGGRPPLG